MKVPTMTKLSTVASLLALAALSFGCAAETEADGSTGATDQDLTAGGTLACTNASPATTTNVLEVTCSATGSCVLTSRAPRSARGVRIPLTVLSAGQSTVTYQHAPSGTKVVVTTSGAKPVAATVFGPSGVVANCQ
jgi:hypothetical protein